MKNYISRKLKQNKAFSLAETLIVVAILVVLMGISMPLIGNWQSKLKMAELDNHAKTIFLEAQNQLIAKKVEGGLKKFKNELPTSNKVTIRPHDFDVDANGNAWESLYHLEKNETAMVKLIPAVSNTHQMNGNYLIEFNPETGEVYSAFYWEKNNSIQYNPDVTSLLGRDVTSRTAAQIGYYGGQMESVAVTSLALTQQVELVNSEELYLKISYDYSPILLSYLSALEITCEVTDEHGNTKSFEVPHTNYKLNEKLEFYYLLDSMQSDKDFKTISAGFTQVTGGELVAGDNLSIVVKGVFNRSEYYSTDTDNAAGNSLFAERSDDRSIIHIGSVRHLRNLNSSAFSDAQDTEKVRQIVQSANIDFENKNFAWNESGYVGNASNPVTSLTPISNAAILSNSETAKTTVNGNGWKLQNLVIDGVENTGLFGTTSYTDFTQIRIEDITVKGTNQVGALAGNISNANVTDCGVYLTTYTGDNINRKYYYENIYTTGEYNNEMEERYAKRKVSGNNNIGGLFGYAEYVTVDKCFAAIRTDGNENVGGFAGTISGSNVQNSYSSGDIYGNNAAGGFVGVSDETSVSTSYTTSDMHVAQNAGGFAGRVSGKEYNSCYSYGTVLNKGDTAIPTNGDGFVAVNNGGTYTNCAFLKQEGYNATAELESVVTSKGFDEHAKMATDSGAVISINASYPYDDALIGNAFPFSHRTGSHYGNWPSKYIIDTSLVYYERYEDGTYGYYCETKLSSRGGEDQVEDYVWVLDSLQERECVEDGYALLSMYNLSRFSYALSIGSVNGYNQQNVELTIVDAVNKDTEGKENKAARLRQQTALTFKGYTGEMEEYRGKTPATTFSISGMYLYQLPYGLQCTARSNVDNFYDRFVVYKGYAKGSDGEGATPILGGNDMSTGLTFFYCPHFAKTAINPGTNTNDLANPATVYVRSARQLNALGRYNYYWNKKQGMSDKLYFKQETDINFSKYTTEYCGEDFRMLEEDSPVKNQPIGNPVIGTTSKEQFKNSYDGQGYSIIDYGVSGDFQFTGLFGEMKETEVRNIVMTVSPEKEQRGTLAGKIISRFQTKTSSTNNQKSGTGALAGLAYMGDNTIENCTAAGYDVEHYVESGNNTNGITMGGLIGCSFSDITNCSASNNVTLVVNATYGEEVFIGGLVGSFGFGALDSVYSGGTIDIIHQNNLTDDRVAIGGVCPGWLAMQSDQISASQTPHTNLYSYTKLSDNLLNDLSPVDYIYAGIGNLNYSDVTWGGYTNSNMTYNNCYYLDGFELGGRQLSNGERGTALTHQELAALDAGKLKNRVTSLPNDANQGASYTYPVSSRLKGRTYPYPTVITKPLFNEDRTIADNNHVHYGDWPSSAVYKNLLVYYEKYADSTYGVYTAYPDGSICNTLCTDDSKRIVNSGYGLLQLEKDSNKTEEFVYDLEGNSYYFYGMDLVDTEYANAKLSAPFKFELVEYDDDNNIKVIDTVEKNLYVNKNFAAAISLREDLGYDEENPLQIRTMEQFLNLNALRQKAQEDIYIKQMYSIYLDDPNSSKTFSPVSLKEKYHYDGGSEEEVEYKICNAQMNVFEENAGTIQNCVVAEPIWNGNAKNTLKVTSATTDLGKARAGFVNVNKGTITNCTVVDPKIEIQLQADSGVTQSQLDSLNIPSVTGFVGTNTSTGKIEECGVYSATGYDKAVVKGYNAYGFADSNAGIITKCYVAGTVTGEEAAFEGAIRKNGNAAGFIRSNTGEITLSYASCNVEADGTNSMASGFVIDSSSDADKFTKCYSAGNVKADAGTGTAYGFGRNIEAKNCYTLSEISANTEYGMAQSSTVVDCYWAYDTSWSHNTEVGAGGGALGNKTNLWTIHRLDDFATNSGEDYPYSDNLKEGPYLYPSTGMPHYGDWPAIRHWYVAEEMKDNSNNFTGIFYYEVYADGSYGIYATGQRYLSSDDNQQITGIINTLYGKDEGITSRGYGVFFKDATDWGIRANANGSYSNLSSYVNGSNEMTASELELTGPGVPSGYNFYPMQNISDNNPNAYTRYFRYKYEDGWITDYYANSTATINLTTVETERTID